MSVPRRPGRSRPRGATTEAVASLGRHRADQGPDKTATGGGPRARREGRHDGRPGREGDGDAAGGGHTGWIDLLGARADGDEAGALVAAGGASAARPPAAGGAADPEPEGPVEPRARIPVAAGHGIERPHAPGVGGVDPASAAPTVPAPISEMTWPAEEPTDRPSTEGGPAGGGDRPERPPPQTEAAGHDPVPVVGAGAGDAVDEGGICGVVPVEHGGGVVIADGGDDTRSGAAGDDPPPGGQGIGTLAGGGEADLLDLGDHMAGETRGHPGTGAETDSGPAQDRLVLPGGHVGPAGGCEPTCVLAAIAGEDPTPPRSERGSTDLVGAAFPEGVDARALRAALADGTTAGDLPLG